MGISAQFENQTITGLMPMSSIEVALTFAADPSIIPSSYVVECLVSNVEDNTQIQILELDLQISKRTAAELSSSTNRLTTSPLQATSALLTVINMGTANETFSLNFDYSNTTNYFQIETNLNVMQLGPGESKDIELSFREIASGGSQAGESLPIQVVASSTGDVIDSLDLILVPQKVGIQMQILPIVDEVKPGEEIRGTIVISNSGNAIDNISVISVDSQCDVVFAESLAPSSSSSPTHGHAERSLLKEQDCIKFNSELRVQLMLSITLKRVWPMKFSKIGQVKVPSPYNSILPLQKYLIKVMLPLKLWFAIKQIQIPTEWLN